MMDALSETLRTIRLVGATFLGTRFTAPWSHQAPRADLAGPLLQGGADRVVTLHMITEGECHVQLDGRPPVMLITGDVVIFPHGDAHRLASRAGGAPASGGCSDPLLRRSPLSASHDGGGETTQVLSGYLACDAQLRRTLLAGLPPVVKVNVRGSSVGPWMEASIRYALAEAGAPRPGGSGVLARVAEVLFIEILRLYMNGPEGRAGWLAAAADRIVGVALNAIHQNPSHPWTLSGLARTAATSRSVLAERFLQLVGRSPIQYLTQWRMLTACNLLCRSDAPLASIAADVGYQTDTTFSRAFRREFGAPPSAWRRSQLGRGLSRSR
jgi:AraC-like DNA-binding protein